MGSIQSSTHTSNRLGPVALAVAGGVRRSAFCVVAICSATALGQPALPGWLPQPWGSAGGPGANIAHRISALRLTRSRFFGDVNLPRSVCACVRLRGLPKLLRWNYRLFFGALGHGLLHAGRPVAGHGLAVGSYFLLRQVNEGVLVREIGR